LDRIIYSYYALSDSTDRSALVEDPVKTALLCVIVGLVSLAFDSELVLGLAIGVYIGYLGSAQIDGWEGER
jgi:hypothetical protein